MAINVMIATPTAGASVYTRYMLSIIQLLASTQSRPGVKFTPPYFTEGALIPHSRNALASMLLETADLTHLLFVDSDIGFEPAAVYQMLDFNKPVSACTYPKRALNQGRLHAAARDIEDASLAWRAAQNYVGFEDLIKTPHASGGMALEVKNGFVRTMRVGMGLTLIRRDALETLRAQFPHLNRPANDSYKILGVKTSVFQVFESEPDSDGIYVGEDLAFCRRWTEGCGGEIWLNVDPVVTHSGPVEFSGRLVDRLKHGSRPG
jgi:hypothetical protein